MANHAHSIPPSIPVTRRALALGAGAFSAIGITAGAAASVADLAALPAADQISSEPRTVLSPDAELIRVSAEFDRLEREYDATFRTMDENTGDVARDRIVEQQEPLLDRMTELQAERVEALRARLSSLLLWDKELDFDAAECEGECFNVRLLAALLRDLDRLLPGRAVV